MGGAGSSAKQGHLVRKMRGLGPGAQPYHLGQVCGSISSVSFFVNSRRTFRIDRIEQMLLLSQLETGTLKRGDEQES